MSQLLPIFLNILLPVFSLVAVGYVAGPRLQIEARSLSRFAYYILVPAFVFGQFSTAEIRANLAFRMALYMIVVTLGGVLVSLIVAWLRGASIQMRASYVLVAAFGNVGNFGLPIIQFKLGDSGILPATFYFLIGITFGFIVGVTAATWHKGSGRGAIWSAFTTPGVVALLPALFFNGFGIAPPLFLTRAVSLLASAMVPVMLVTLGIQLAGMGRPKLLDGDVILISLIRLLAGPAFAILLASWFGLSGVERGAGIIQASMPAAVLTSLIALEHDLLPDFVTTTVLFSTLLSAVTLTLVLAML
ncbi:MAG: AEC family transporter [Caldilineaceae bacterium]